MEGILHHLGCKKHCKLFDKLPINYQLVQDFRHQQYWHDSMYPLLSTRIVTVDSFLQFNPDKPRGKIIEALFKNLKIKLPPSCISTVKQCFCRDIYIYTYTNLKNQKIDNIHWQLLSPTFFGGWVDMSMTPCGRQHKLCGVSWAQYSGVAGRLAERRNGDDPWPTGGRTPRKTHLQEAQEKWTKFRWFSRSIRGIWWDMNKFTGGLSKLFFF